MFLFSLFATFAAPHSSFEPGGFWTDTNGTFIQAHGGTVQYLDNYDCFGSGEKSGCWIWYGEDKTEQQGIHCYVSRDLYNWIDRGPALYVHNVMPEMLNGARNDIVHNLDNLRELKRRGNLKKPEGKVTLSDIEIARNFLRAYVTEVDPKTGDFVKYDEDRLLTAFVELFGTYSIVERPKMLYNKKYNNYVLIFHSDGPANHDVVNWINDGMGPWILSYSYIRACLGFAVSDSPFGPFKLVNVQRMHWVDGYHDESKGMARDQTVFIDDWEGEERAYAIYSSENNRYTYISRLDDTYTTWDVPQGKAVDGVDFKSRIVDAQFREAPAIFKYDGYYYLMTSGTSGWAPNAAKYHRSKALYGPYEDMGNPCEGDKKDTTFDSQSAFFVVYNQEKGQFIYFGDRWLEKTLYDSRYIWLPVELNKDEHKFVLHNTNEWKLEDFFKSTKGNIMLNEKKNNDKNSTLLIGGIAFAAVTVAALLAMIVISLKRRRNVEQKSYEEV